MESTGAGNFLICTIIIPLSSIVLNSIFIGEVINTNEIIGLLVIIVGLLVIDGRVLGKKFVYNCLRKVKREFLGKGYGGQYSIIGLVYGSVAFINSLK